MNMKIFETSDFHQTITLCALGFQLVKVNKSDSRRFIFEFESTPEILQQSENYFQGKLRLDPRIVLLNSKLVKDRMYEKNQV